MEKRTQIEARITKSIIGYVKKLTFILSNFMYFVVPFNYSFNRTMQTMSKNYFARKFQVFYKNSLFSNLKTYIFAKNIRRSTAKNFRWVAFSRFRFESKCNFWQINSIFEKLVLRTSVQIQQSFDFLVSKFRNLF